MVLHEFDPALEAVINPWEVMKRVEKVGNLPDGRLKLAVTCFEGKTIDRMVELLKPRKLAVLRNANGETPIEQNRCATACQGCGAVFLLFSKIGSDRIVPR